MNTFVKKIYMIPLAAATLALGSCVETVEPTDRATKDQLSSSSTSFSMLVNGLKTKMIETDTYGSTAGSWYEAAGDWGYPCFMYWRDLMLDGMPTTGSSWNYQYYLEAATDLADFSCYPYYYYYSLIANTNRILGMTDEKTASTETKQSLAIVHAYRALCYMQLSTMFEYYNTGISDLDKKAEKDNVLGLTIPIVTENTTAEESKNNPRAPFYTMYRFINRDLTLAEKYISGYNRSGKNDINADVIDGLAARFWLNLGTRFERNPADLASQLEVEGSDNYADLGITTANDCFQKASEYAEKVIASGYKPMTEDEWHNAVTGFNTEVSSWIWDYKFTSTEQTPNYWCSITGLCASEPVWGIPAYGGEYRCISKSLYDKIGKGDWRKTTWVDPYDAGSTYVPDEKYQTQLEDETTASKKAKTNWSRLPEYANLKFRPALGDLESQQTGMLVAIPLMRVEEMYFIDMEAALHTQGLTAAKSQLERFLNLYRYNKQDYTCSATTPDEFIKEMIAQKYIEFWGEDVLFADYKRLGLQVDRTQEDTNYLKAYRLKSKAGYAAPWMNFYIPETERSFNKGVVMNPDPVSYIAAYCK